MKQIDYVVVGAGLTGATFAREKADAGHTVFIFDKRPHIGGNAYDERDPETDLLVHVYGPHLFHTNSEKVEHFVKRFAEWVPYEHRVKVNVESLDYGQEGFDYKLLNIPLPFNFTGIDQLYSEAWATSIKQKLVSIFGQDARITLGALKNTPNMVESPELQELYDHIYFNIFANYTQKMWDRPLEELGPTVADRVPLVIGYDDRYFADKFQALPVGGYTQMVKNMLDHPNIEVRTGCLRTSETAGKDFKILHTGRIDEFFGYQFGVLPYRSMEFIHINGKSLDDARWYDTWPEHTGTWNFPRAEEKFTRVTSMRNLGQTEKEQDYFMMEVPHACDKEHPEPFYPVPVRSARELYARYESLAEGVPRIKFAGRLGSFQYLNMDAAIAQALKIAKEF